MIKIEKVSKSYKNVVALDEVSLTVEDNSMFALLGFNGAGKSTLINIICSLIKKDAGKVWVNDLDLDSSVNDIRQIVGLMPQENAIANNLTVAENLAFMADLYGVENSSVLVDELLNKLSLTSKKNARAKQLSGGQKRRLNLGMALISKPKVLILDEPTLGLDVKSRRDLWEIVQKYKQKNTVLFTTHYLEEAEKYADRIGIIKSGKIVICGTKDEIIAKAKTDSFENAFLKYAGGEDE